MDTFSRRDFLVAQAAAAAVMLTTGSGFAAESAKQRLRWPVCLFVKFLQSLSFADLARTVSEMGFQGIEATVRTGGQILPEQAVDELPQLVAALQTRQLEVTIMASSINRADQPLTEPVLRTAAKLGIKRYRMDYYRYDLSQPVALQLENFKSMVKDLAALNRELGIQAIYQNHSGARFVGASVWDLHFLLDGIPREQIGIAYDTQHAAVESGLSWPVLWNLVQPHLAAVYVKNAKWNGRSVQGIPLSEEGAMDPRIFSIMKKSLFQGPVSLHVEYLPKGTVAENLAAIRADYQTLQSLLKTA